jgi:glycerol-3-phosphate acyltransferase PlsY
MSDLFITAGFSYLLGSIPFGYILVRTFQGRDIRQTGSGNIGATNVSRTSPVLGALTLLLDACKGFVAVAVTRTLFPGSTELAATAALCAILGHVFPVWLRFRGGKGVATGLGSFLVLAPKAVLLLIAVFIAVVLVFRYVSLGSIIAVALFPLLAWFLRYGNTPASLGFISAASLLILVKHHDNFRRLLSGTEHRFELRRG